MFDNLNIGETNLFFLKECASDENFECPLKHQGKVLKLLKQRIDKTPSSERFDVESYNNHNLIPCLDYCYVVGRPPNERHHKVWQSIWLKDYKIYTQALFEIEAFGNFNSVKIPNKGKYSPTMRERFEVWYVSKYMTPDAIRFFRGTSCYSWVSKKREQVLDIAKKIDSNSGLEQVAQEHLELHI